MGSRQPKPRPCGLFQPDPDIPADQQGRQACARCGRMGEPGDARHTLPAVEVDVRQRAASDSAKRPACPVSDRRA